MTHYPGIFAGRVISNKDPLRKGRLTLQVPEVLGESPTVWADPIIPGSAVPKAGSKVWVMFASGDPRKPVWLGAGLPSGASPGGGGGSGGGGGGTTTHTFSGTAQLLAYPSLSLVDSGITVISADPGGGGGGGPGGGGSSDWWLSGGSVDTNEENTSDVWATYRDRPVDLCICYNTRDSGWGAWMPNSGQPSAYSRSDHRLLMQCPPFPDGYNWSTLNSGGYDSYWRQFAGYIKAQDQAAGRLPTIVSLAWEANGNWFYWGYNSGGSGSWSNASTFVAGYQRAVSVAREVYPDLKFGWVPNGHGNPVPASAFFPGAAYVDYIGADYYDMFPASHSRADFRSLASQVDGGLLWYLSLCRQYDKLLLVPEWGIKNKSGSDFGGDNPGYVDWMVEVFQDAKSTGHMGGENYFQDNDGSNIYPSFEAPSTYARYQQVYAVP